MRPGHRLAAPRRHHPVARRHVVRGYTLPPHPGDRLPNQDLHVPGGELVVEHLHRGLEGRLVLDGLRSEGDRRADAVLHAGRGGLGSVLGTEDPGGLGDSVLAALGHRWGDGTAVLGGPGDRDIGNRRPVPGDEHPDRGGKLEAHEPLLPVAALARRLLDGHLFRRSGIAPAVAARRGKENRTKQGSQTPGTQRR